VLAGRGTTTLTILGAIIEIDATARGEASISLDYTSFDATTPFSAALMPGQHFIIAGSNVYHFSVASDGLIDYDAALDAVLTGRGTKRLRLAPGA
jgi:hypothetical protein